MDTRRELGNRGEQFVAAHLEKNGFIIRALNYVRKTGEIDIIAQKDELVVFVEVKVRTTQYFNVSSVINRSKQRKIITTAKIYTSEYRLNEHILRFDVALLENHSGEYAITYIPNAFTAHDHD
jgi:putative endonuclease